MTDPIVQDALVDPALAVSTEVRFSEPFRSSHLGASAVPAACEVDEWEEPLTLWEKYVGRAPWPKQKIGDAMWWGHKCEPHVIEVAEAALRTPLFSCPTLVDPDHPWRCATPDRVDADGIPTQVKTIGLVSASGSARSQWGEPGTDEVPPKVLIQVTVELDVLRRATRFRPEYANVAALIAGQPTAFYRVPYDAELASALLRRSARFWRYVEDREPPPTSNPAVLAAFLARQYERHVAGKWVPGTSEALEYVRQLEQIERDAKVLGERSLVIENMLKEAIGDAEGMVFEDEHGNPLVKVPYRTRRGRQTTDYKAVAEKLHEIVVATLLSQGVDKERVPSFASVCDPFTTVGTSTRAFGPIWRAKQER